MLVPARGSHARAAQAAAIVVAAAESRAACGTAASGEGDGGREGVWSGHGSAPPIGGAPSSAAAPPTVAAFFFSAAPPVDGVGASALLWGRFKVAGSELLALASAGPGLDAAGSPSTCCGRVNGSWGPDAALSPGAAVRGLGPGELGCLGRRDEGELLAGSGMAGSAVAGLDLDGDGSPRASCGLANGDLKPVLAFGPDLVRP